MSKKCPLCDTVVSTGAENSCPRCGVRLKSYFGEMSEEEKTRYVRELAQAVKDGSPRRSNAQRPAQARADGKRPSGHPGSTSVEEPSRVVYSENTPIPVLERDPFEYIEERKARIEKHPPVVAGTVHLVKDQYDLSTGVFPARVQWQEWVEPLLKQHLVSTVSIRADRDLARSIYQAGSVHAVYVRLKLEGDTPVMAAAELYLLGKVIPLVLGAEGRGSAPSSHRVWKEPITGMELVRVEGGCYPMGSGHWDVKGYPHEKPVHEVSLDSFWIGKTPVTQGAWRKVMGADPSHFKLGEFFPVECVSWLDVKQFLRKLTVLNGGLYVFRLPTEAEWEYACRSGGKSERFAGGTGEGMLDEVAWHVQNSGNMPHEVGRKKPNGLGLHDMSGNVWEWCEDIYNDTAYERHERSNPTCHMGEPDRVIRGGSWYSSGSTARCASRGFLDQTFRRQYVGFRLVRAR